MRVVIQNDDEKDADVNAKVITVYKVDMHCEDCSRKIRRTIELFEGDAPYILTLLSYLK